MANRAAAEEKQKTIEKRVSLTVTAPEEGSQDIQVEVKRQSSPGKKRSQRRFAAFMAAVLLLLTMPMIRTGICLFPAAPSAGRGAKDESGAYGGAGGSPKAN